jgi:hypothetical protein
MLTNDSIFLYYCTQQIGWCRNLFFQMAQGGVRIPERLQCVKVSQDSGACLRSVQKMLQILEAGLGISVKIKASPS